LNQEYTDFFDIPDRSATCSMVMLSYPSSINIDFVTARTFFLRSRISSRLGRPIRVNCLRGASLTRRRRSDLMSRRVKVVGRRTGCSGHWLVTRPKRGPNAPTIARSAAPHRLCPQRPSTDANINAARAQIESRNPWRCAPARLTVAKGTLGSAGTGEGWVDPIRPPSLPFSWIVILRSVICRLESPWG